MAYDKEKLYNQAMSAIEEENLFFIEDVVAYIPCSKPTFYEHFPVDSYEFNTLKDKIEKNKIHAKQKMKKKWVDSDNPTLQVAAMKLLGTKEERKSLSSSYTELTGEDGEPLNPPTIIFNGDKV
jgi:hypothetical protein